ncbi:MAG TPA: carboxypeptidase-like regulatory domain-containing protein, partial [Chitinophagales bacterium]|nr:carboxypeptidase-like regulatory domain-containing protein [Chitinophagales bacterium]
MCFSATAQDYSKALRGRVVDSDTKQPLEGVNVVILNMPKFTATTTDNNGQFSFEKLKAGRYSLKFSMVSYHDAALNNVSVTSGKETILNVEMTEKISGMQELVVTAERDKTRSNNEFAPISARSFSMEEIKRFVATMND